MVKYKKQEGGDSSSNFQAENINYYQGLSYKDVKDIATDIFSSNFIKLKDEAAQIAIERANEIIEKTLEQLKKKGIESLQEFSKPGMQDALFTAQKEYAKSGDTELGDLLVDIIVDRAETTKRNMLQIVLDESLHVATKLTIEQLDTLTLLFLLIRTVRLDIQNYEYFKLHFKNKVFPFVDNLLKNHSDYNYLEYLRCGQIRAVNYGKLEEHFRTNYKGCFAKGFTEDELTSEFDNSDKFRDFIIPCFHERSKFQIGVLNEKNLDTKMTKEEFSIDEQNKLKHFFEKTTMTNTEVKNLLIELSPKMKTLFEVWENSDFKNFELSCVGIAIAHANYRRRTGDTMNLSIWIK